MRPIPAILLAACLLPMAACGAGEESARGPDVLLITLDTTRADRTGFGGYRLENGRSPTPVLDALAAEAGAPPFGLSPVPLTLPAHVTLLSGRLPDATGVRENDSFAVPGPEARNWSLLAEDLRRAGWDTGAFVSGQPLERAYGLGAGFRVYDQPGPEDRPADAMRMRERSGEATVARALAWIGEPRDGPYFAWVHFFDPHMPYERNTLLDGLPPGPQGDYISEIAYVDQQIGRLLAALPAGGRETLVVVVGDHGEGLGEHGEETHGYFLHESTLRVPFIVRPPTGSPRAAWGDVPPRLEDVYATVLALTGAPSARPAVRDGRNLMEPPATGWTARAETLYPWYQFRHARLRSLRDRTAKLIEGGGTQELYAWREDPLEARNLAADRPAATAALLDRLLDLAARPAEQAQGRLTEPSPFSHYTGGRSPGLALEPGEDENRGQPRTADRLVVVNDLERARAAIRDRDPGRATMILEVHADRRDENPALLFWTARAHHLAGRETALAPATRLQQLATAESLYARHEERFHDPRSADSRLKIALDRYAITGDPADLGTVERLCKARVAAGSATALTHAFGARARELAGDLEGALEGYLEARRLDPEDPRLAEDVRRLQGALGGPQGGGG